MTEPVFPEAHASHRVGDPDVDPGARAPLVENDRTIADVTESVAGIVERKAPRWWLPALLVSASVAGAGILAVLYLVATGIGVWGLNSPVGWAFDITNFVFWIGIGHAGTLISAILFLLRQRWRTSINRAAEAMTLFAVACAGLFPLIHVGRLWRVYFTAPVPNHLGIWPNFNSPLLWDVFAVSAYATVSLLFWYVGMVPDLATMRDRAQTRTRKIVYGIFACGWRGGQRQWKHYEMGYLLLAGLSTPLVLSVHSIVSFDFAVSQLPGWHTTIFPPYFVVGAIFGGFAMVLALLLPARALLGLKDFITNRHLENMCKVLLFCSCVIAYAYGTEFFTAWYSGNPFESFVFLNTRVQGPYAWAFWVMVFCNLVAPQVLWSRRARRNVKVIFTVAILVTIGMWFERFVIIVTSLHRDALPGSWGSYTPTWVEILTLLGTFGIFSTLYLLFIRFLPVIAMSEVKHAMDKPGGAGTVEPSVAKSAVAKSAVTKSSVTQSSVVKSSVVVDPYGLIATYAGPDALMEAAARVREEGYTRYDAYSPYPIHGMGKAMGQKRSSLGWWTLGGGVFGALLALCMQFFISTDLYPILTAGKPFGSWPAWVPITFELGILFAAFATVFGMYRLSRLPKLYHPLLKHAPFRRISDDGFCLVVSAKDAKYDPENTAAFLEGIGGTNVQGLER